MSQFFKDFEKDDNEPPKRILTIPVKFEEEREKISNHDRKINELQELVFKLEDRIETKFVDKFIKNLSKYKSVFKEGLPSFILSVLNKALNSDKVGTGSKHKIREFINLYERKEEKEIIDFSEEKTTLIDPEIILDGVVINILSKKVYEEAEMIFIEMKNKSNNEGERAKLSITLINLYIKNKVMDYKKMCNLIEDLIGYAKNNVRFLEIDFKDLVSTNIGNYLSFINNSIRSEDIQEFLRFINEVRYINKELVGRIELEIRFFKLNEIIENDDEIFGLLYFIRNKEYKKAKEKNEKNTAVNNYAAQRVQIELGIMAFKNNDFKYSFEILQCVYFKGHVEVKKYLLILCIILGEIVKDDDFFDEFIEGLRVLEDNIFLLQSECVIKEIYRAFYLLKNDDLRESTRILNRVISGMKFENILVGNN